MIPNPTYYGQPEGWKIASIKPYADRDAANKIPSYKTIYNGVDLDVLTVGTPLDNSICYAAIADDSPIARQVCINGSDYDNPLFEYEGNINFIWGYVDTKSQLTTNRTINLNDLSSASETDKYYLIPQTRTNYPYNNIHHHFTPLISIIPRNFVLLIYIECDTPQFKDRRQMALDDYINNTYGCSPATHPNITSVLVAPVAGSTMTDERSFMAINDNGGMALAYNMPYDLPQLSGIYDYWSNAGDVKRTVRIWGAPKTIYYANYYQYVKGKDGTFDTTNAKLTYYREYGDGEWILRCAASLGLFFTVKRTTAASGALDDVDMYCGVIDSDGLCHGDYTRGTDNRNQPQYSWTTTNDSTYDPYKDIDPTNYNNNSVLNSQSIATFNTIYAIDEVTAHKLARVLSDAMLSRPTDTAASDWALDTFLTNNPLDCIVSLKKFPCEVPWVSGELPSDIYFGNYHNSQVRGFKCTAPYKVFRFAFSLAENNFLYPVFGDTFLDYEPYTKATLYIPFCGTIEIPPSEFLGHNLNIDLVIDFITGACCAYVRRDNVFITSAQGECAVDIPVSGLQGATLDSQIFHAAQSTKAARFGATAAVAGLFTTTLSGAANVAGGSLTSSTGALAGFTRGIQSAENATIQKQTAEYEQSHIQPQYKQVSGASPLLSQLNEYCCRLIIYRPIISDTYDPNIYADTVGFATIDNDILDNFEGFTAVAAVDLSGVPCTAEERAEIESLLTNGVHL